MRGNTLSRKRNGHRRGRWHQKGVYTHPSQVPGVLFRVRDQEPAMVVRIAPKLKKGAMTNAAVKLGYIKEGQAVGDIPNGKMDDFGRDLVKVVGPRRAMGMVNAQINLRKNRQDGFKTKMIMAKGAIRRKNKVVKVRRQ